MRKCLPVLLSLAIGCTPAASPVVPKEPADRGEVVVIRPVRKSLVRRIEQPGAILPLEEARLFARVPGNVAEMEADIGQTVEANQVLAVISVPELDAESTLKLAVIRRTEADLEQSRKALASSEAGIATADAAVVEANALFDRWDSEAKRIAKLVEGRIIDAQTGDETRNQFRAAGARVASAKAGAIKARADRDKSASDVRSASARIDVAKADSLRLEAMRAYARIRAPFAGIVTRRKANTGDLVQPGNGTADWLFAVARMNPVRVAVAVPEADAGLVVDKAKATVAIPALGLEKQGTVTRTSWSLDPASRTLRAEIELPNPGHRLRPGMYVHARIEAVLPEAWTLPTTAVHQQGEEVFCFFVEGDRAVRTPIRIGRRDAGSVEALERRSPGPAGGWVSFTGGEAVAAQVSGLVDGQAIRVKKAE